MESPYQRIETWSFRIGKPLFGLPVRVRWDALIVPIALYVQSLGRSSAAMSRLEQLGGALAYSVMLYLFVYLHELGHALAARRMRVPVSEIVLTPLGGTAVVGARMPSPRAEAFVAGSGPAVSAALAAVAYAAMLLRGTDYFIPDFGIGLSAWTFLANLFLINAMLAIFNMLPVFDMDGARVLRAVLAPRMGAGRATYAVALLGQFLCVPLAVAGFYAGGVAGALLILIAVVNFFACERERYAAQEGDIYGDEGGWISSFRESEAAETPAKPGFVAGLVARRREAKRRRKEAEEAALAEKVDEILAKVKASGLNSLTRKERAILMRASKVFRRKSGRWKSVT
jgi:Zn-dependent protease